MTVLKWLESEEDNRESKEPFDIGSGELVDSTSYNFEDGVQKLKGEGKPGLEWWEASLSLLLVIVGVGILALPQLPHKGGVIWVSIITVICWVAIVESGFIFSLGITTANRQTQEGGNLVSSYEDFSRAAMGPAGEAATFALMSASFLGLCASYALLIATSLSHFTGAWLGPRDWLLVISPVLVGLALLPNVTAVIKLVPLAVICIFALCIMVVGKSFLDAGAWQHWPDASHTELHRLWPESFADLGIVFSVLFGAFGVNANVPSILTEMKDQRQFPKAFAVAIASVFVLYVSVTACGYYAYGEFVQQDILMSLTRLPGSEKEAFSVPADEWTGPKSKVFEVVLSCLLLVKLLIGFPLNAMAFFQSVQTSFYVRDAFPLGSSSNMIMRLCFVAIIVILARGVPNFSQLFAIVNAVTAPFLQLVFPLLFTYQVLGRAGARRPGFVRIIFHVCIVTVALFTLTVGLWVSLGDVFGKD